MMDEIVERLPDLTKEEITLLEAALHRERQRRASATGEAQDSPEGENPAPLVTEVLEYRPHEDGYLQLELRRYVRRDGSARARGPYWYFQYHKGGKRRKLYLGKTDDPAGALAAKRTGLSQK